MKVLAALAFASVVLVGCEKTQEEVKRDFHKELGVKLKTYSSAEIVKDFEKGIYAPPYSFNEVTDFHNYCLDNLWTQDTVQRLTPMVQEEIYALAGYAEGRLSGWRDEISSPALNQNFTGHAITVASPTSTAKKLYPELLKQLQASAYYKKSGDWFMSAIEQGVALKESVKLEERNEVEIEQTKTFVSVYFCLPADFIVGVHGGTSLTADLLKQTHQQVSKQSMASLRSMLEE